MIPLGTPQHAVPMLPSRLRAPLSALSMLVISASAAFAQTGSEIHGTVTFYHDFRKEPAGKRVLKLCRAESCQAADGSSPLTSALNKVPGRVVIVGHSAGGFSAIRYADQQHSRRERGRRDAATAAAAGPLTTARSR